jgi:hypothetical protein
MPQLFERAVLALAALRAGHPARRVARFAPVATRPSSVEIGNRRVGDAAGDMALAALTERAAAAGIEVLALSPRRGDFNAPLAFVFRCAAF